MSRRFGDLKVRPKLMVLHNLFFMALACAVYFSLIPLVESRMQEARTREVSLILQSFQDLGIPGAEEGLAIYQLQRGTPEQLQIPVRVLEWLTEHRGQVWRDERQGPYIYRQNPATGVYYRLKLPLDFYLNIVESAKIVVFIVMGIAYVLAVLLLEMAIMPRYVYQPLRVMLVADAATRRGARNEEMIDEAYIPGDEIGQIMRSRNETVGELRKREDDLAQTLERLETAKQNLEAQDRLVSLGLLSASVAHEMNTPLAVLHGSIEKLMETVDSAAAQSRLQRMIRVTGRLRKISEGLLDFARVRKQEMIPVALAPLIDEAWGLVTIDEKASEVRFENRVAATVEVVGNADRLVQVFVNLLRNAVAAAPAGAGRIEVEARCASGEGQPGYVITVDDNGPGIPDEVLPGIFEAFVTTRLDARGTGLGLTVVEGIVSQHGGAIAASNRPGGGARLEVRLPARQTAEAR